MKATSPAFLFVRRILPVSALLLATACEPLACQGRVTDGIQSIVVDDKPEIAPRCPDGDFEGDVDVTTQAELDTLRGCNTIRGAVIIHDSVDIVDLGALAELQRLDNGYLLALGNAALTTINLPALANLDNGLTAIDNPELTAVNAPELPNLEGDLTLRNNPKLAQLAFPRVQRVQTSVANINGASVNVSVGNVILGDLPSLTSLDGAFEALEGIDGSLEVFRTGLRNFQGLGELKEILNEGGAATARTKFRVDKLNPALAIGIDFDDKFDIVDAGNPSLEDFGGLENLRTIAGDIVVGFNPALNDFSGLDDVKRVENGGAAASLYVFENDSLTSFLGFDGDGDGDGVDDGLDTITGSLFVGLYFDRLGQPIAGGNDSLENLDGLDQLVAINGNAPGAGLPRGLLLAFNDAFDSLQGLDSLATLNGDLVLLGSQQVGSLSGAPALTTVNGNLVFGQLLRRDGQPFNPAETVEELKLKDGAGNVVDPGVKFDPNAGDDGFDALTTVNRDLIVAFSDLGDLQLSNPATANLATVGGRVILYGNASSPSDLTGLQTVTSMGGLVVNFAVDAFGQLQPFPNNGFESFAGLTVTTLGTGGLHIGFDDNLDEVALATLPTFATVQGSVTLASAEDRNGVGPSDLGGINIDTIGGDLTICAVRNADDDPVDADLDNLTELDLDGVNRVGGSVLVAFCSLLENTSANINEVGGAFELTSLPSVETVVGLDQLGSVGSLLLHDLPAVTSVAIPNLGTVEGNLELVNNPALTSFDFNVDDVGGTLRLVALGDLVDVAGLESLQTVGGDLDVIDCDALEDTVGLNALQVVGGDLRLRRLDSITNQARAGGQQDLTFNALVRVGGLEIAAMNDLEDLAGLQTLERIGFDDADNLVGGGVLTIDGNPKLETLFGLQGLSRVGRKVAILNNENLVDFAFDDDNQDREPDVDNGNGIAGEPEDPDNVVESGFVEGFTVLGQPVQDGDVLIGGSTGVVEVRNNPALNQDDFLDAVVDNLNNYEGFLVFCGNEGSVADDDDADRAFFAETCPEEQDGTTGLF
jgi:hypothetical protein